jgi:hypothetical protein
MRIAGAYALVAAILAVVFAAGILGGGYRAVERSDYMTYHVAARIVLAGDGACLYEVECQAQAQRELIGEEPSFARGALPYNSPPWLAALVAPLGMLPLHVAFALFTVLGLAVLGLGAWRVASWDSATAAHRALAVALVLSAWPTVIGAIRGQSTLPVAGLLALSVAGSGWALGLAALKPTLLPLWTLWLILRRRWRQLVLALAVAAALVFLSLAVVHPQALAAYPAHLLGVAAPDALGVHPEEMINWRGAAVRLGAGLWLIALGTVATIAAVAWCWWWSRSSRIAAGAAFLATPLVLPHANQHEAILGAIGVVLVIAAFGATPNRLVVGAIGLHALLWIGPFVEAPIAAWLMFGAELAWLLILAWLAAQQRRSTPQSIPTPPGQPVR